jgi:mycothiol synthase
MHDGGGGHGSCVGDLGAGAGVTAVPAPPHQRPDHGNGEVSEPQLFMRLPELSDLPPAPPHEPCYALRAAVPTDHGQLAELLCEAFGDRWDAKRVAAEFSPGNGVEATYVVVSPVGVVATASARRLPDRYPEAGYVHYVGARVSERGRRLGEVVTRRVLVHFVAAGLDQAVLETDDFRLPAVRTYLRLGFVPEPRTPGDARRWSKVLRNLARTGEGAAKVPGTAAGASS